LTRRDETLLGLSATTFLLLGVWIGPHAACWLVATAAILGAWVALCRRFPIVGYFSRVFLGGFLSGLVGYRSGYRRRRW
jgi:hypothetical protein